MIGQNEKSGDFVAVITHELKLSLTAITVSAELLPNEKSTTERLIQSIIRNVAAQLYPITQTEGNPDAETTRFPTPSQGR